MKTSRLDDVAKQKTSFTRRDSVVNMNPGMERHAKWPDHILTSSYFRCKVNGIFTKFILGMETSLSTVKSGHFLSGERVLPGGGKIPKGKGHNATGEYYSYNYASLKRREGVSRRVAFAPVLYPGKGSMETRKVKGFHVSPSPSSLPPPPSFTGSPQTRVSPCRVSQKLCGFP